MVGQKAVHAVDFPVFDTGAFTLPDAFTFGNVSRTLPDVRGPGLVNFDLSLIKNTRIRERINLQFRHSFC